MTANAATSSGIEDRVPGPGGSEDGGRPDDLAEDFLPISWSVHSTAPLEWAARPTEYGQ
jgi:hypothetical protein